MSETAETPRRGRDPWKKVMANMKVSSRRRYHVKEGGDKAEVRKTRIYAITVTPNDLQAIFEEQGGLCYWLGTPLDPNSVFIPNNPLAISTDRLDNDRDYSRDNIVITTRFANLGRGSTPADEFRSMADILIQQIRGA